MGKQTAVEWLVEIITKKYDKDFATFYGAELEQAKAMEKKQNEENIANAITFGWELSHYHRDKEPEKLLQMQKDFITCVIEGGYK